MSTRLTLETIIRDDDDADGQTIRNWHIQRENDFVTIRARETSPGFIMLRVADVPRLKADLDMICAVDLKEQKP